MAFDALGSMLQVRSACIRGLCVRHKCQKSEFSRGIILDNNCRIGQVVVVHPVRRPLSLFVKALFVKGEFFKFSCFNKF